MDTIPMKNVVGRETNNGGKVITCYSTKQAHLTVEVGQARFLGLWVPTGGGNKSNSRISLLSTMSLILV